MNFIITNNEETAQKLRELKYSEIPQNNSPNYCFINNGEKITFDTKDIIYTNILNF